MGPKRAKAQIRAPSDTDTSTQAQEFYGVEGHGVDSESDGDSEPNEGDDSEEGFHGIEVPKRKYHNKKDIIDLVANYHARVMHPYKVSKSDKRRYNLTCPVYRRNVLEDTGRGTLLVACFRNGNIELQIVRVAIVSIENQANWDFFLRVLMANIGAHPHFLISDRNKGLVPVATSLNPVPNHFFCFRHLMENFNRKFKSKPLKNAAWDLARALNEAQFVKQAAILSGTNSSAEAWLMDVGKEKLSLCYSPCPRFGTLTLNNVESINEALRKIRKLPVLDCLMAIERYIGEKWASNNANAVNWGLLTHCTTARMKRLLSINRSIEVSQYSESSFVVTERTKCGEAPIEYIVQLFETSHV